MKLLALDTATEACSVALWDRGHVIERYEEVGRSHTERLLPMLQGLLADAGVTPPQLDGIVCGIGPGSFAGLRIGVGLAKGLALGLDRPAVGISSLAMLAQPALAGHDRVLCAIDARTEEVYLAAYARTQRGFETILPPWVGTTSAIPRLAAGPWTAVGNGLVRFGADLRAAVTIAEERPNAMPHARDAFALAIPEFEAGRAPAAGQLEPLYLRNKVALTLVEQAQKRIGNKGS